MRDKFRNRNYIMQCLCKLIFINLFWQWFPPMESFGQVGDYPLLEFAYQPTSKFEFSNGGKRCWVGCVPSLQFHSQ